MLFLKYLSQSLTKGEIKDRPPVEGGEGWQARMGWRYVTYIEGDASLSLSILPMADGADRVCVPAEAGWMQDAPIWARRRRAEILSGLQSIAWNRDLMWQEGEYTLSTLGPTLDKVIPSTIESTEDGRELESQRLFEPDSFVPAEQAREMWIAAARFQAKVSRGPVKIEMPVVTPGSVLQEIVIPALRNNPNVILVFK